MAITPDDKKISQMAEVAPSAGMYVPLVDLTQLPPSQNVRATAGSILALVDLSGYVPTGRVVATSGSLTGGGDLSVNRTLSLDGDSASPGNSQYYGTDGAGTKGFFPLPSAGTGTVTSFSSGNLSPLFTTGVATATTTPALTFSLSTQSANLVFAGPTNGAAAAPTFRSLVAADIPDLTSIYQPLDADLTAIAALGTTAYGRGFLTQVDASAARTYIGAGTGSGSVTSVNLTAPAAGITVSGGPVTISGSITLALADDLAALEALTGTDTIYYRSGVSTWTAVAIGSNLQFTGGTLSASAPGTGTVTSVGLTMPSGFSVGGSPVTTTGTLAVTTTLSGIVVGDGSGLIARTATGTADRISVTNGSGVAGNPTFDIAATYVGQTSITTLGTIATGTWSATTITAARGGTGQTTYAEGDLLYGNGGGTLSKLGIQPLPGYVLFSGATPSWAQLSTLSVTGISGTANEITASASVGSVTLSLPAALTFTGKTVTGGIFAGGAFNGTVGATTPSTSAFTNTIVDGGSGALPSLITSATLRLGNPDGTASGIQADSFGAGTGLQVLARRAAGTRATPTATVADSAILDFLSYGHDGTSLTTSPSARWQIVTDGLWSGSNRGTRQVWTTTINGSTSAAERMRLSSAGNLLVGTTSDPSGGPGKIKALGIDDTPVGAATPAAGSFTAITLGSTTLLTTSVSLTDGAAASAGTLLNAPVAGNPTKWIPINDNGTTRYIPAW